MSRKIEYHYLFEKSLWMPGWGEMALSALLCALVSGIILIPVFDPSSEPFRSVSQIISSGFFGHFLHSFHSYSGDLFLIATFMHTLEYLIRGTYQSYQFKSWFLLILLALVSILTVFSGFLSIGSKESVSAFNIFESILASLPLIGNNLVNFILQPARAIQPLLTIYLHHAATFTIIAVMLTYIHIRRLKSERYALFYTILLLSLFAAIFPGQIGFMPDAVIPVVKGPWYFIGLQEMLAWQPAVLAGIIYPLLLLTLLILLPTAKKLDRPVLYFLALLFFFYLIESFIGTFLRGEAWQFLAR